MKRLLLVALLFAPCGRPSSPIDELMGRTLAFEKHWNLYVRHLFGCPDDGLTDKATCGLPKFVDYGEFEKACRAARDLFGIKGGDACAAR